MGPVPLVDAILSDLRSDDGLKIHTAIAHIRTIEGSVERNQIFETLLELLKHTNPWFRLRAVHASGALGDQRAVDYLIETITDDDEDAGPEIIEAHFDVLAAFKDERAIEPLIGQIHRVDFKQAWCLSDFGGAVVMPMIEALKNQRQYTRWQAAYWLGNSRDKRAMLPLVELIHDKNTDQQTRIQGVYSLAWIGSSDAIPYLEEILKVESEYEQLREAATHAIEIIQSPTN